MENERLNELIQHVVDLQLKKPRSLRRVTNTFFSRLCVAALYCYYNGLEEKEILKIYRRSAQDMLVKATEDKDLYTTYKKGWLKRDFIQLRSQGSYESLYRTVTTKISRANELDSMGVLSILVSRTILLYDFSINRKERKTYMKYVKDMDGRLYKICKRVDAIIAATTSY